MGMKKKEKTINVKWYMNGKTLFAVPFFGSGNHTADSMNVWIDGKAEIVTIEYILESREATFEEYFGSNTKMRRTYFDYEVEVVNEYPNTENTLEFLSYSIDYFTSREKLEVLSMLLHGKNTNGLTVCQIDELEAILNKNFDLV